MEPILLTSYTPAEGEDPHTYCNVHGPREHLLSEIRYRRCRQPLYMEYLVTGLNGCCQVPKVRGRQREVFNGLTFSFATWKAFRDYCTTSMPYTPSNLKIVQYGKLGYEYFTTV